MLIDFKYNLIMISDRLYINAFKFNLLIYIIIHFLYGNILKFRFICEFNRIYVLLFYHVLKNIAILMIMYRVVRIREIL